MQPILFALLSLKARFEAQKEKERGATAVEYGLIVALIAAGIVTIVALIGDQLVQAFQAVSDALSGEGFSGS